MYAISEEYARHLITHKDLVGTIMRSKDTARQFLGIVYRHPETKAVTVAMGIDGKYYIPSK